MADIRYAARPVIDDDTGGGPVAPPTMWSKSLVTFYETDPGLVAAVLPKPLEVTDNPMVRLNFAQVDFPGGVLGASVCSVTCMHEGTLGLYDLTMVMTSEQAVIGGRETFGEPKKLGNVELTRSDDRVHGKVSRMGVDYMELDGRVVESLEPRPLSERVTFYFKFMMNPDGSGFDHDPSLVYCHRTEQQRLLERVEPDITLRDSNADPIADLPIRRIASCEYSESNTTQTGVIMGTVPSEWLLPFAHQRYDFMAPRKALTAGVGAPGL